MFNCSSNSQSHIYIGENNRAIDEELPAQIDLLEANLKFLSLLILINIIT
jgi:hypothetical protein